MLVVSFREAKLPAMNIINFKGLLLVTPKKLPWLWACNVIITITNYIASKSNCNYNY